jgi:hypothetical protein
VLENTQFALIATVHKLYSMVRNQQQWELGEPELNDRGQPVIHNIASKLGCIRPNADMDLPVHSVFPEDEAGLAELARQLEEQQKEAMAHGLEHDASYGASPSELDASEFDETDYRRAAFGAPNTMSPQSMTYTDFDTGTPDSFHSPALAGPFHPSWSGVPPPRSSGSLDLSSQQYLAASGQYMDMDMLNQSLLEAQGYGTIKPHVLAGGNPDVMLGIEDPMMYAGYDAEMLRL